MNDRFRFRVININTNSIDYIDDLYWFEENGMNEVDDDNIIRALTGEYYINQCTGLKDKNGKLIYEGDIVKCYFVTSTGQAKILTGIMDYSPSHLKYVLANPYERLYYNFGTDDVLKVIGNIYEHKELLQESEVQN